MNDQERYIYLSNALVACLEEETAYLYRLKVEETLIAKKQELSKDYFQLVACLPKQSLYPLILHVQNAFLCNQEALEHYMNFQSKLFELIKTENMISHGYSSTGSMTYLKNAPHHVRDL